MRVNCCVADNPSGTHHFHRFPWYVNRGSRDTLGLNIVNDAGRIGWRRLMSYHSRVIPLANVVFHQNPKLRNSKMKVFNEGHSCVNLTNQFMNFKQRKRKKNQDGQSLRVSRGHRMISISIGTQKKLQCGLENIKFIELRSKYEMANIYAKNIFRTQ